MARYVHPTDATKKCISFELLKQKGAVENADTIGYDCALMDGPCVLPRSPRKRQRDGRQATPFRGSPGFASKNRLR